jgi:excisionase family DNA binding protein
MKATDQFHTVSEVSELLKLSKRHIWRLIAQKKLIAHRFGRSVRISWRNIKAYIAEVEDEENDDDG